MCIAGGKRRAELLLMIEQQRAEGDERTEDGEGNECAATPGTQAREEPKAEGKRGERGNVLNGDSRAGQQAAAWGEPSVAAGKWGSLDARVDGDEQEGCADVQQAGRKHMSVGELL
jgi:hypothetical protein